MDVNELVKIIMGCKPEGVGSRGGPKLRRMNGILTNLEFKKMSLGKRSRMSNREALLMIHTHTHTHTIFYLLYGTTALEGP